MAFQGSILLIRQGFVAGVKGLQEAVDLRVGGQVADADAPAGQRVARYAAFGQIGLLVGRSAVQGRVRRQPGSSLFILFTSEIMSLIDLTSILLVKIRYITRQISVSASR